MSSADDALDHVFGYTIGLDITDRDLQITGKAIWSLQIVRLVHADRTPSFFIGRYRCARRFDKVCGRTASCAQERAARAE